MSVACLLAGTVWAAESPDEALSRLEALQREITLQSQRLEALQQSMAQEQRRLNEVRQALGLQVLEAQRGGQGQGQQPAPQTAQAAAAAPPAQPVGQAPRDEGRPAQVAQIFEQPGVLTPRGRFVLEPSLQYAYSSNNRVALVGYTIIPAITIGVIDVREVKRNTFTAALTGRYGLTNRLEIEGRLPYAYRSDDSIATGLSPDTNGLPFSASGRGIGDVELTARYQITDGGVDKPYLVGSLRYKSRTGKDPFEVVTRPFNTTQFAGFQEELPIGSGFHGLQPALTALFPSDPAVFFGTISYLHSFARDDVVAQFSDGPRRVGKVAPGGVFGFNFGMGLALNEKSSFSLGYDHSSVGRTKVNGDNSTSLRSQLGTLILGYSYRFNAERSLNVSLGVGVTRDTPDVTLTVRMPYSF
ncbi:acetate kinase [uncultured Azohydromonas sp.]|uniref:acetate kinase n=1 Tax=uncultured Azohydromonas sp. TaxID=487342 RepID=UPI00260B6491|nr:acetate kinase [uncultured Azohydromonas sp.]